MRRPLRTSPQKGQPHDAPPAGQARTADNDHAGHRNYLRRNIHETLELSDTVEKVLAWAEGREDTVIIMTGDHECGGCLFWITGAPENTPR